MEKNTSDFTKISTKNNNANSNQLVLETVISNN